MNDETSNRMKRALALVRAGDLDSATRLLRGDARPAPDWPTPDRPAAGPRSATPPTTPRRSTPAPEDAEFTVTPPRQPRTLSDHLAAVERQTPQPRPSLRVALDALARARAMPTLPDGGPGADAPLPDGARFDRRTHQGAQGAVDYLLYIPASLPATGRGLIVMLHGCTQTPADFAAGTRMNAQAEAHGLLVAYPAQRRDQNPQGCWNWFRAADQHRDAGEPALLAGLTRAVTAEFGVAPARTFAAGLSAGGAMAAILGAVYPDVFAAVGVHSGLAAGSAQDAASAFAAMRGQDRAPAGSQTRLGRVIVFHGDADRTVHPVNGDRVIRSACQGQGVTARQTGRTATGAAFSRTTTTGRDGVAQTEHWLVEGLGHAWTGGSAQGSHTDPDGPDASAEMVRFFLSGTQDGN